MPPVFMGVIYHWLGGLASGSFYVPYKAVKKWSWEVYWLAGGFVSWIFAPWILAACLTDSLVPSIFEAFKTDAKAMGLAYMFGFLWGIGGLTFGLTMRYLGMSLGMAIALGYCTVLGTIMPPIADGTFVSSMKTDPAFVVTILGLGLCMIGVVLAGVAGTSKEREMDAEAKKAAIKEFNFLKGLLVATISGVFSACMAYGLQAAEPLAKISIANGTDVLWSGLPKLCVVLLGGFTSNFLWCALLLKKNKTAYQFFNKEIADPDAAPAAQGEEPKKVKVNMIWNYFFSGLAGLTWYFQFFFYSMGETKMGEFQFSSWTLHMASIIIFSSLWGLALREWRGTSRFTKFVLGFAIFTLLYSTIVVGYGNLMKTAPETVAATAAKNATAAGQAFAESTDGGQKAVKDVRAAAGSAADAVAKAIDQAEDAINTASAVEKASAVDAVKASAKIAFEKASAVAAGLKADSFEGAAKEKELLESAAKAFAAAQTEDDYERVANSLEVGLAAPTEAAQEEALPEIAD